MTEAFNASAYLAANPDLVAAGVGEAQAYEHFRAFGYAEGRPLSFDAAAYKEANPDLQSLSDGDALSHFLNFGRFEDRLLTVDGYFRANPDLTAAGLSREEALDHYISLGRAERRFRDMDPDGYRALNPDLRGLSDEEAIAHYAAHRITERRLSLDGEAYLAAHADVALAGVDPSEHWVASGEAEGRSRFAPAEEDHRFSIVFDYRFDTEGFFDDPARREALEAAADMWEDQIRDDFPIVPAGTELIFPRPTPIVTTEIPQVRLNYAVDDMVIFVGSDPNLSDFSGIPASAAESIFPLEFGASVTNVAPDGQLRFDDRVDYTPSHGSIRFNSSLTWNFSLDGADVQPSDLDFVAIAAHEIGHALGINNGTNNAFSSNIVQDQVTGDRSYHGPNVLDALGSAPPMDSTGHFSERLADGTSALLEVSTVGGIRTPSVADLGVLKDIGYEVTVPTAATAVTGTAAAETLVGGFDRDSLNGSDGDDSLDGGLASDTVLGGAGNDTITDDTGADSLLGGAGDDSLFSGIGDDFVDGGAGNDTLFGGNNNDTIVGGDGDDWLFGDFDGSVRSNFTSDNDSLFGGAGNDTLQGGEESDTLDGGEGADLIFPGYFDVTDIFGLSRAIIFDGDGDFNDTIIGAGGPYTIRTSGGDDYVSSGGGGDLITNTAGDDTIIGGGGDDTITGHSPTDLTPGVNSGEWFVFEERDGGDASISGFDTVDTSGAALDRIDIPESWTVTSQAVTDGNLKITYRLTLSGQEFEEFASITLIGVTALETGNIV